MDQKEVLQASVYLTAENLKFQSAKLQSLIENYMELDAEYLGDVKGRIESEFGEAESYYRSAEKVLGFVNQFYESDETYHQAVPEELPIEKIDCSPNRYKDLSIMTSVERATEMHSRRLDEIEDEEPEGINVDPLIMAKNDYELLLEEASDIAPELDIRAKKFFDRGEIITETDEETVDISTEMETLWQWD